MFRLSDIVGNQGLSFFIEIALILFFVLFIGILIYSFFLLKKESVDKWSHLPLDDTKPPSDNDSPSSK
jgi:cbb3-type cytochrome oxidase subunit 3